MNSARSWTVVGQILFTGRSFSGVSLHTAPEGGLNMHGEDCLLAYLLSVSTLESEVLTQCVDFSMGRNINKGLSAPLDPTSSLSLRPSSSTSSCAQLSLWTETPNTNTNPNQTTPTQKTIRSPWLPWNPSQRTRAFLTRNLSPGPRAPRERSSSAG